MDKLLNSYKEEHIRKWDTNKGDFYSMDANGNKIADSNSFGLTYFMFNGIYNFEPRDFVEKSFCFSHDGAYYVYCSSIPKDIEESMIPAKKGVTRGESVLTVQKMWRDKETGCIHYHTISQYDFKLRVPSWLLATFLPSGAKKWLADFCEFYEKHADEL